MCDGDAYDKEHIPIPDNGSSGGSILFPISSSKEVLIFLG